MRRSFCSGMLRNPAPSNRGRMTSAQRSPRTASDISYFALKWLHLIGAAILFGTGAGIAFFAWFGYRRGMQVGEIALVRGLLQLTVVADTVFTAVSCAMPP